MARALRISYPGAFYHVTSRGNERKEIFKNKWDRERFLQYLETATLRYNAVIHVYSLMNNHYHIFLETPKGNLPQIMRHINGAYTTYFNAKHKRSGHLFQGRYKAILVDADEYAKELSRYIHLNPVRANIVERAEAYKWSSLQDYIGVRKPPEWLQRDFILSYFGDNTSKAEIEYKKFISAVNGRVHESPLKKVFASTILGSTDFIERVREDFVKKEKINKEIPALKKLSKMPTMEDIFEGVGQEFPESRLSRNVKLYLCHRFTSEPLKIIGDQFNLSESAVSHAVRKVASAIANDQKLSKRIEKVMFEVGFSRFKT
jgi:putative transposase